MKQKILLVEDSPNDAELIMVSLKENRISNEIIWVKDGAEALKLLLGDGKKVAGQDDLLPAMVLLDLKLPKVDGLEVLQRLRADVRTKLLPIVILTSSDEESDKVKGYSYGANSYVCKPVDFQEFGRAVRDLGLYWVVLNESPLL